MISNAPPEDVLRIYFTTEEEVESELALRFALSVVEELKRFGFEKSVVLNISRGSLLVEILTFTPRDVDATMKYLKAAAATINIPEGSLEKAAHISTIAAAAIVIHGWINQPYGPVGETSTVIFNNHKVTNVEVKVDQQVLNANPAEIATRPEPEPADVRPTQRQDGIELKGHEKPPAVSKEHPTRLTFEEQAEPQKNLAQHKEYKGLFFVVQSTPRRYRLRVGPNVYTILDPGVDLSEYHGFTVRIVARPVSAGPLNSLELYSIEIVGSGEFDDQAKGSPTTKKLTKSQDRIEDQAQQRIMPSDKHVDRRIRDLEKKNSLFFVTEDYEYGVHDDIFGKEPDVQQGVWDQQGGSAALRLGDQSLLKITGLVGLIPIAKGQRVTLYYIQRSSGAVIPTRIKIQGDYLPYRPSA
jgi:hypothetical protein